MASGDNQCVDQGSVETSVLSSSPCLGPNLCQLDSVTLVNLSSAHTFTSSKVTGVGGDTSHSGHHHKGGI
ncbi:hypothetical protein RRG08_053032 [Elysia crispata]|uniref:Uncharacterized protein n=1 Tax=Elysia crispata TaxID=231223 RepID=A0AAE0Y4X7_9GAST|nr:hypothetical protein RRG08_053032 [Elysia crispata]